MRTWCTTINFNFKGRHCCIVVDGEVPICSTRRHSFISSSSGSSSCGSTIPTAACTVVKYNETRNSCTELELPYGLEHGGVGQRIFDAPGSLLVVVAVAVVVGYYSCFDSSVAVIL